MKRSIIFMLTTLLALLAGCQAMTGSETEYIMSTEPSMSEVMVTAEPTPEPMTPEKAAILYARFLQDDLTTLNASGRVCYHSQFYSGLDMERAMDMYRTQDLTGDGIPDLFVPGPGLTCIWTVEEGEITYIGGKATYETLLPNGGIFYHRPGGAPEHHDYHYEWLSPESQELPEISAQTYDNDNDGILDTFSFWSNDNRIDVTEEEWNEAMAPYFALLEEEYPPRPTFREWAATLDVELPPPEMNETKACRIFPSYFFYEWTWHNPEKSTDILRVWDFDGDSIPEVYENQEPYLAYGIVGLHVEELGSATELGTLPEAPLSFREWYQQLSKNAQAEGREETP